jgi:cold shock protein
MAPGPNRGDLLCHCGDQALLNALKREPVTLAGPLFRRIPVTILSRSQNARGETTGSRYSEVVQRDKGLWIYHPDTGGKDVFVHISAVERAGLSSLNEGAKVSYEVTANRGKESAENLRVG